MSGRLSRYRAVVTRALLVEMFDRMVVAKDKAAIPRYYDPEFVMVSNGITAGVRGVPTATRRCTTPRSRMRWSTTTSPGSRPTTGSRSASGSPRPDRASLPRRLELVLIAAYREGRILRVWELTWPNWADLPAFERYGT